MNFVLCVATGVSLFETGKKTMNYAQYHYVYVLFLLAAGNN